MREVYSGVYCMGKFRIVAMAVLIVCINFAGCGKKYFENENDWETADGMVRLTPRGHMTIAIEEVD